MAAGTHPDESPFPVGPPHLRRGFTLLEVLASVAILSIWYVVIAGMATDGLRKLGVSNRLLEASEIADRLIAEIEETTLNGSVPEYRDEETEEGEFLVHVFIVPFGFGGGPASETPTTESPGLAALLKTEMPGFARHVVAINVLVAWDEGQSVKSVRRTTYAFDLEKAVDAYQGDEAKEGAEEEEAQGEDDEENEDEEEGF